MFCYLFCLKVLEVGFGEKLFSKSFSPSNSRYNTNIYHQKTHKYSGFPHELPRRFTKILFPRNCISILFSSRSFLHTFRKYIRKIPHRLQKRKSYSIRVQNNHPGELFSQKFPRKTIFYQTFAGSASDSARSSVSRSAAARASSSS